jgi:hypothetical protein
MKLSPGRRGGSLLSAVEKSFAFPVGLPHRPEEQDVLKHFSFFQAKLNNHRDLESISENFIFFATYEWAQ